jgi:Mg/Co/Ni transporter MgtE
VQAVYVVNEDNELVAWADPHRLFNQVKAQGLSPATNIETLSEPATLSLRADMPLGEALDVFMRADALTLPVTSGQWHAQLVGEVSRHDLLLAVQDRMSDSRRGTAVG